MKKIFIVFSAFFFSIGTTNAQENNPEKLAEKMADAMKDSLNLNKKQRDDIYAINMQLHDEKVKARKQSTNRAVVGKELQRIENTRDHLYKQVLKENEYALYKQKKRNLIKKH